jgi:hypothetical protein
LIEKLKSQLALAVEAAWKLRQRIFLGVFAFVMVAVNLFPQA